MVVDQDTNKGINGDKYVTRRTNCYFFMAEPTIAPIILLIIKDKSKKQI